MTQKVGLKGQVVVPKRLRDEVGLRPGAAVDFELRDGGVLIRPHRDAGALLGMFEGDDLTGDIEREHGEELLRDEQRADRWG